MRLTRVVGAVSALALTAALALFGAGPAQAAAKAVAMSDATGYVALGDSYSAGVGAGSYDSGSGSCKRSTKAYPALWAAAHTPASFTFTACSGARTGDVLSGQIGALNGSTGLVSISIGGNDAGFSDTMSTCVFSDDSTCLDRIAQARDYIDGTLPGQLDRVYSAIGAKAPSAHVVVLGYPRFYRLDEGCAGLSDVKRSAINDAADAIDAVIAGRAAGHGFTYADPNTTFGGHELCSGDAWLHSLTWPVNESYHPTADGQSRGYLPVFTSAA
ncbi:SGNH/GDSL hydrolase family protein [Streptomyces sp. UNOC14_S4]|uniref:SGNH/GDSL hydrolase family protein n=1 Tax=Streptomyces sp. UNOC14_S4 TaxID=2872340 RepID=UPI001E31CE50|nr:SGNH/GDSL hydrolase family protein [Streptomyces sp. UNOC14_S4]MCC3767090.1 SGNH/GDSL hydrolase family protein [Streptomyces sp. UNOC14_S4]